MVHLTTGANRCGGPAAAAAAHRTASPCTASDPASAMRRVLFSAPEYALGTRLDPGPRPIGEIEPDYPDPVYLRSGVVVLRLLIGDTGHVDDVAVVSASSVACSSKRPSRPSKGTLLARHGRRRPVESEITVEVEFAPINRGARISGRTY